MRFSVMISWVNYYRFVFGDKIERKTHANLQRY